MKKASSDYKKSFNRGNEAMDEKRKVATDSYKSYNRIEKSFKLLISAVTPAMTMTPFCCNRSRFLLPPAIEFATTSFSKKIAVGV